jgi:hypothetical protein
MISPRLRSEAEKEIRLNRLAAVKEEIKAAEQSKKARDTNL